MLLRLTKQYTLIPVLGLVVGLLTAVHADAGKISLQRGSTELEFQRQDKRVVLTGLTDRANGRRFLNEGPALTGLWRLEFRPQNGDEAKAVVLDEASVAVSPLVERPGKGIVRLLWNRLNVGSQENAADVIVTISSLPGTASQTDWRIAVHNRVRQAGLWQVDFPRISRLVVGKEGEAATPFGMGMVVNDPVHNNGFGFQQRYPEALYSMQFAALSDQGSCLYLATHDPHAYVKEMTFNREKDGAGLFYQIRQFPEGMGLPQRDYVQPYPCVVGVLGGDWVNAAKAYRKWVLANSDWMRTKLPLNRRKDMPDWFKRLPLWAGFHGMTDDAMQKSEAFLRYMDVPVAIHMYHWHTIDFDTKYPDFWPPKPEMAGYVKRLQKLGAKVMPYTNTHLMDELAPSWKPDEAWRYTALGPDGKPDGQIVDANRRLDAMCPATPYWQNKFNDLTTKLVGDMGVDGIYLDQVACMTPTLCFNAAHGHPVGGGYHWVAGNARQIQNIRRTAAGLKRNVFLTTESAAEPYDFDAYLRCNEGAPFLTPIWQLVYSGYRLSFGFNFYEKPEWIVKLGTQYLWGVEIGWANQFDPKDMPENAAFMREVARARYAGSDYLALGELLRAPVVTGDIARVKTTWRNFGTLIPIDWPSVQASLWRAPSGKAGIAVVNMGTSPQTATITVERQQIGFGKGKVKAKALYPVALSVGAQQNGDTISCKVQLPPLSAAMVVLERNSSSD